MFKVGYSRRKSGHLVYSLEGDMGDLPLSLSSRKVSGFGLPHLPEMMLFFSTGLGATELPAHGLKSPKL
jgi:hypothetical protein